MSDIPTVNLGLPSCEPIKLPSTFEQPYIRSERFRALTRPGMTATELEVIQEEFLATEGQCAVADPDTTLNYNSILSLVASSGNVFNFVLGNFRSAWSEVHKNIGCMLSAMLTNQAAGSKLNKVHNWIRVNRRIGKETVQGIALEASLKPNAKVFVIKMARDPSDDRLAHEAVFGLYCGNLLKELLPNFMYVYGFTKCSPAVLRGNEVVNWCEMNKENLPRGVSYMFTENIKGAVTFWDWLQQDYGNYEDYAKVLLMLLNALHVAYRRFRFLHNDLHLGNVMIRDFRSAVAAPAVPIYSFRDGVTVEGYVQARFVPYIIDFGLSEFQISPGLSFLSPYPDYRQPIGTKDETHDLRRVLEVVAMAFQGVRVSDRERKIELIQQLRDRLRERTFESLLRPLWTANFASLIEPLSGEVTAKLQQFAYTPCHFFELVATNQGISTPIEYLTMRDAILRNTKISDDTKQNLRRWLDHSFNTVRYFLTETKNITAYEAQLPILLREIDFHADEAIRARGGTQAVPSAQLFAGRVGELQNFLFVTRAFISAVSVALATQGTEDAAVTQVLTEMLQRIRTLRVTLARKLERKIEIIASLREAERRATTHEERDPIETVRLTVSSL